jgi:hypothetical protein
MGLNGQARPRGWSTRLDSRPPSLAILLLIHLRERAKLANRARNRVLAGGATRMEQDSQARRTLS